MGDPAAKCLGFLRGQGSRVLQFLPTLQLSQLVPSQELGASGARAGAVAPWFVQQVEAGNPGRSGSQGTAESRATVFQHGDLIRSPGVHRWCVGRWDPKQVLLSLPAPPQQRTGQGFSEQSNKDTQQEAWSAGTGGLDTHSGTPGSRALTDTPPLPLLPPLSLHLR